MNLVNKFLGLITIPVILFSTGLYFNGQNTCQLNISGSYKVRSTIIKNVDDSLDGEILPIPNALVKVERKNCNLCKWKTVFEKRTDSKGKFSYGSIITGNACKNGLKLRAKIKLQSSEIEMRGESTTDEFGSNPIWYLSGMLSKDECSNNSPCDFKEMIFHDNGKYDLKKSTAQGQADIWFFYNWASLKMDNLNHPLSPNKDIIKVIYPLNRLLIPNSIEGSYVNPLNKIVHIHKDHLRFDVVMHELAHLWAFNHTTGESMMKDYLIKKLSTHELVSNPAVAFHEGFADFWMMSLKNIYLQEKGLQTKKPEIILKNIYTKK